MYVFINYTILRVIMRRVAEAGKAKEIGERSRRKKRRCRAARPSFRGTSRSIKNRPASNLDKDYHLPYDLRRNDVCLGMARGVVLARRSNYSTMYGSLKDHVQGISLIIAVRLAVYVAGVPIVKRFV